MNNAWNYLLLIRFQNQIGTILLFIPCFLGLVFSKSLTFSNFFLFLTASFFARSVGCILNDIADKEIDANTSTTSHRVIASGKVSIKNAFFFAIFLVVTTLPLLFLISKNAFLPLGISALLVIIYPYSKRFFPIPQAFLGVTYASGFVICASHGLNIPFVLLNFNAFLVYIALIFWIIFYDTIYAKRDFVFDKINKIKASTVFFAKIPVKFFTEIQKINFALIALCFASNAMFFLVKPNILAISCNIFLQTLSIFVKPSTGFKLNALCVLPMFFLC
jgi:4-hydroxybenzoate polyprenyltransferase